MYFNVTVRIQYGKDIGLLSLDKHVTLATSFIMSQHHGQITGQGTSGNDKEICSHLVVRFVISFLVLFGQEIQIL